MADSDRQSRTQPGAAKARDLPWFSQPQLNAAIAAIQSRQLSQRDLLLWADIRDGVAIPDSFTPLASSGLMTLDDEALRCQGMAQPAITT